MNQQPGVAENLELLANFGPDISIIRMKLLQFTLKGINVGGRKTIGGRSSTTPHLVRNVWVSRSSPLRLVALKWSGDGNETTNNIQHIQRPAALSDGNIFQRFDATELFGDFGCRGNFTLRDDGNRPKSYGQEVNQGLASF